MPERPRPTAPIIIEVCGGSTGYQGLIENLHHGLEETPALKQFYPHLDFDELVAFAASSWKRRDKYYHQLFRFLESSPSVYQIFSEIYSIGFPWLNKNKAISPQQEAKHQKLNPFQGRDLEERLNEAEPAAVEQLIRQLQEEPCEYVFECQYHERKMLRGGDNYKLEPMHFHNVYPKRGRIVPGYAKEIVRIFQEYPREYVPYEPKTIVAPLSSTEPQQISLI
ncbi:hypothetical protein HZC30_07425 [Candidatus Woesearchaeota archaeon]|nr:hypothetical protein [Candidatus Woesearchaeota archaeon]